jgi:ferrous iron transport protein A
MERWSPGLEAARHEGGEGQRDRMRHRVRGAGMPVGWRRGGGPWGGRLTAAAGSLAWLPTGAHAVVREVRGGRELGRRLAGMGLTVGARLEVLQNRGHGPVLVRVRDTRVALGYGEAAKIMVEEADA